jgi:hypothetical protein
MWRLIMTDQRAGATAKEKWSCSREWPSLCRAKTAGLLRTRAEEILLNL